ncbi:MAG: gamma carbonic anhydrase family protein [Thermodesulfobacteriota bacterium]|nr:gamma carbonic anhydrase family protein [Thermodesulfobacteriota bacterium]
MLYEFDDNRPGIGKDTYVSPTAILIGDISIGDKCYVGHGAILRGDYGKIEVGTASAIEEGVVVHAPPDDVCRVGNRVTIGHGAIIHCRSIGDLAVIGMGAILSIWAEIGQGSIVAEGSVVKMNQVISPGVMVGGNPARIIREVMEKDLIRWGRGKQLYVDLARKYLELGMKQV